MFTNPIWRRRSTFGVVFFWMFLEGVEYAVVFPTLWEYLLSLGIRQEQVYFLGLCMSAPTMCSMVLGLFVGRILDKRVKISRLLLILNTFQIAGNMIYFMTKSPNWILISRLIVGVGETASLTLLTDVCRSTTMEERTSILMVFNVCQQVGLLLGPACNLFLRQFDFAIGQYVIINKLNAPGFFMTLIYLLLQLIIVVFYYDLSSLNDNCPQESQEQRSAVPWSEYLKEFLRPELIALILLRFMALFGQTCLETIVTPFMKLYFDYGDFENSLLFLFSGLELMVVFAVLIYLCRRLSDRHLIILGIIGNITAYIWGLVFFSPMEKHNRSNVPYFAIFCALDLLSLPFLIDITLSLTTKLLHNDVQGFANGFRRFFNSFAFILGPMWGSGTIHRISLQFAVPLVMLILASFLFFHSYDRMKPSSRKKEILHTENINENTPLLA